MSGPREDIVQACPQCHGKGYVVIAANYPIGTAGEPSERIVDALLPWLRHHRTCGVHEGGACGCGLESALHAAAAGAAPADGPTKNCPTCGPTATVHHPGRDWCVSCQWEHRGAAPAVREAWARIDVFCRKRIAGPTATILDDLKVVGATLAAEGETPAKEKT
jgi:hypothetical protein